MSQALFGLLMAPAEGGAPVLFVVGQFGVIIFIFYWLLIRPQRKERQQHQEMVSALQKGDSVVTVGGIIGTIVHLDDDRLVVKSGDNTRLVLERSKVSRLTGAEE